MSEARDALEQYLARTGLSRPADAAQQYQVALMRQWSDHLDDVLEHNMPDWPELRSTIIREFIYGVTPQAAEADLRAELSDDLLRHVREHGVIPPPDPGMPWQPGQEPASSWPRPRPWEKH
jgi:hypothetical protein